MKDIKFVSGLGQHHTNDADHDNPNKKLTPYLEIDLDGIRALVDNPQKVDKTQAQWFIPSRLKSRTFKEQQAHGEYWMLWADFDTNPKPLKELNDYISAFNFDYEIYSSRSATLDMQKGRILIPLNTPLSGVDWINCQKLLNDTFNNNGFTPDRSSERAAQLCYLPNAGKFYESHSNRNGIYFDVLTAWANNIQAHKDELLKQEKALEEQKLASAARKSALKLTDMPDLIGAFNSCYTVQEILLKAGYDQRGNTFIHSNSESGSYSAGVKGERVHALSSNDPLYSNGKGGHDAFSAFRVLFACGDQNQALKLAGDEWLLIEGVPFNQAMRAKQLANASNLANPIISDNQTHPLAKYRDYDVDSHTAQEFILDDKIQVGIVLLAGGHGCGKTTQLVPLLCRATHLCTHDALRPTLKRKIIYVTEDPNQVERILHSMWVSGEFDNATKDDVKTMFKVVEAKRMHTRDIVKVADTYLKETVPNINNKTGLIHEAKPLVVVDTINATIHLENDNDNSEVGEVIATFKQEFKGLPVLLIAHLAKGLLRSEIEGLTARGAGAWEADAHQVLYLVKEDNGTRWLDISYPKHRFHSDADGILFEGVTNDIPTTDILGNLKNEKIIHGKPSLVGAGGKKALKDMEAISKHNRELQTLSEKIYSTAKEMLEKDAYITRSEIYTLIGGNKQTVLNVIKGLIKLGVFTESDIPKENMRNKNQKTGIQLPSTEITKWDISKAGTA
jgi:hypothetical protein